MKEINAELKDIFANISFLTLTDSKKINNKLTEEIIEYIKKLNKIIEQKIEHELKYDIEEFNKKILLIIEKYKEKTPFHILKKWNKINKKIFNLIEKEALTKEIFILETTEIEEILNIQKEEEKKDKEQIMQILLFKLKNVVYAIESKKIEEMTSFNEEELTIVPNSKEAFLGFINLRGEVIPLIDLRIFFNIKEKKEIDYSKKRDIIIAIKTQNKIIGILVDIAEDFININEKEILNNTNFKDISNKYIKGIINHDIYDFLVLLDIEKFLEEDKLKENFLN